MAAPAFAHRDERGMPQPDEGTTCLTLNVRQDIHGERAVGRATFSFGAYEKLLEYQRKKRDYPFMYFGIRHTIRVTRLSVGIDYEMGCVVCEVDGALWWER